MVFAGYLEYGRKCVLEPIDGLSYLFSDLFLISCETNLCGALTYMLIDQKYTDIFSLTREALESIFNLCLLGLRVYHEEVSSRIWWFCNMSYAGKQKSRHRTKNISIGDRLSSIWTYSSSPMTAMNWRS